MAKVMLHPMFKSAHGTLGDIVFRCTPQGGTSAIKRADMSDVEWTPEQTAQRQRLKAAIAYARAAMANPAVRLVYEETAREQDRLAFRVAVSDYLKGINRFTGG